MVTPVIDNLLEGRVFPYVSLNDLSFESVYVKFPFLPFFPRCLLPKFNLDQDLLLVQRILYW